MVTMGFSPRALVTMPDRAKGRGQHLEASPAKQVATRHAIPVLQPEKLDASALMELRLYPADFYLVVAYGAIIPKIVYSYPPLQTINVHPSLLPKYRGPSPIQGAVLAGEKTTGVSIMLIDEKMDHGPILVQETVPIAPDDTAETLGNTLADTAAKTLARTLPKWITHALTPTSQKHEQATVTKLIKKEDGHIDWSKDALVLERQVRALQPWPGSWTVCTGKKTPRLTILRARVLPTSFEGPHGTVLPMHEGALPVHCNNGELGILELKPEGKRAMTAEDFVHGYPDIVGSVLA